jgi:hypothetical protein
MAIVEVGDAIVAGAKAGFTAARQGSDGQDDGDQSS